MTVRDKMTKAELLAELTRAETAQHEHVCRVAAPDPPAPVAEARAIEVCIRAFDTLEQRNRNINYGTGGNPAQAIDRALRYLASKYGVPLIEVRTEPCSRPHVDAVDTFQLGNAIGQALSNQGDWERGR